MYHCCVCADEAVQTFFSVYFIDPTSRLSLLSLLSLFPPLPFFILPTHLSFITLPTSLKSFHFVHSFHSFRSFVFCTFRTFPLRSFNLFFLFFLFFYPTFSFHFCRRRGVCCSPKYAVRFPCGISTTVQKYSILGLFYPQNHL